MATWIGPTISEISREAGRYRWLSPPITLVVAPRKWFSHFDQVPLHRRVGTCVSCYHFIPDKMELPPGTDVDVRTRMTRPVDQAPYRSGPPAVFGFCAFFYPVLIGKLHCQDTCPYHDRKPDPLQFEDDAMTDFNEEVGTAPYVGPVVPG